MAYKVIGVVEVISKPRVYPLDGESVDPAQTAILQVGSVFPVYEVDTYSYMWVMEGFLNVGAGRKMGDGLFKITPVDVESPITVRFPTKSFGREEFLTLLRDPQSQKGEQQRLNFTFDDEEFLKVLAGD